MRTSLLRGLGLCLSVLLVAVIILVSTASAAPPPPDFWGFQVKNTCGADVTNVQLKFFEAINGYQTLPTQPQMAMTIQELADGQTIMISVPKMYCVAQIKVHGECGAGKVDLCIMTRKADYDPATPHHEYAGFTSRIPAQPKKTSPLEVEFLPAPAGAPHRQARLVGQPHWGGVDWADPPVQQTLPIQ